MIRLAFAQVDHEVAGPRPDIGKDQDRIALGDFVRHMLAPTVDQAELAAVDQLQSASVDQRGDHLRVFRRTGMLDGERRHVWWLVNHRLALKCRCSETVRIGVAQAVAEEVGEQQVEAIPLAFAIQRQEEQLHGLQALQQRLAVLAPGQALAGRRSIG